VFVACLAANVMHVVVAMDHTLSILQVSRYDFQKKYLFVSSKRYLLFQNFIFLLFMAVPPPTCFPKL
jgi:hypothetical protein